MTYRIDGRLLIGLHDLMRISVIVLLTTIFATTVGKTLVNNHLKVYIRRMTFSGSLLTFLQYVTFRLIEYKKFDVAERRKPFSTST